MKKMHPMSLEQLRKMIALAHQRSLRDTLLLSLAAHHGMRASELAGLRMADVNLKDQRIFVRSKKGSNSASEALLPGEAELLSRWFVEKPEHALVFPSTKPNDSRQPGELTTKQIYRIFRRYAELAGVPDVSRAPHAFRHTLGQCAADSGMDIKSLQIMLRHRNINSTAQYYTKTQAEVDAQKAKLFA
jgi:type 1 fimbriae regulatory protein FimB